MVGLEENPGLSLSAAGQLCSAKQVTLSLGISYLVAGPRVCGQQKPWKMHYNDKAICLMQISAVMVKW